MRKVIIFATIALSLILTGCATIISGTTKKVTISSTPPAATVFVDNVKVGKTPLETMLTRGSEHNVKIKLDGYQTYETVLVKTLNPWCLGNIFIGGLIGIIIDSSSGALNNLSPGEINAVMTTGSDVASVETNETTETDITTSGPIAPTQLKVGDSVKFYNYALNTFINGVVKEINAKWVVVEYKSFKKTRTTNVKKSDIKWI